jgi:serine protease Do
MPDLNMAPGYKPVIPRGKGPTLDQFKSVADTVLGSIVEMISGYRSVGLGTVVGKQHILAKATELDEKENLRVEMPSGVWADAEKMKTFEQWDLALIRINTDEELVPVNFDTDEDLARVGTLVTAFDSGRDALGWGVVGVASRSLMPKKRAFLGVQVKANEGGGVEIVKVVKGSAAEKSGLKVGDLIRKTKDREAKDPGSFTKLISSCKPGEEVLLEITREGEEQSLEVKLGKREQKLNTAPKVSNTSKMGTKLSEHRYGYPEAMQHDVPLAPNQMGGPLVSFDGYVIGVNIARAGRTKTFAVPSKALVELLEKENLGE